ncbi:MAG: FG-GAP repeat protein [Phycisphaeraceae bacterium]|nr:FG-GAP repeat protein [Phycisphaerales bacterium]MCB9861284.1 FG-GAP repeat protein [Phycisphaeraceae bacterium]
MLGCKFAIAIFNGVVVVGVPHDDDNGVDSGSVYVFDINRCYADCDTNGQLNLFDYICFGNAYANGCP